MSISAVSYGSTAYSAPSSRSAVNPVANDWKNLGSALDQGNVSSAISAFNSLSANLAKSPTGTPAPNSTVGKALSTLRESLQDGDMKSARNDFASLKVAVRGGDHHSQAVASGATSYNSAPTESSTSSGEGDTYYSSNVGTRFSAFA